MTKKERAVFAKLVAGQTASITTATLAAMDTRHAWFRDLDAEHRSWITLVARAGIDGFTDWVNTQSQVTPTDVFSVAPRSLMRKVSLQQTVELIRTTIDVVEAELINTLPDTDRSLIEKAILLYSREVAFAAAEVYARAAEVRGAWDARLEALVVDAIIRGEADETVVSRASTLGWAASTPVCVVMGNSPTASESLLESARRAATKLGFDVLAAVQGDRLIVILGGEQLTTNSSAVSAVSSLLDYFAPGPVIVGPVCSSLVTATASARDAVAAFRAAPAWAEAPRPVSATELLPERALSGDGRARRELVDTLFAPLVDAGGDLLETAIAFFDNSGSVEGTGRALYVHPNTVRYRLKRIHEVTRYTVTDARDAYAMRMAISLGRLLPQQHPSSDGHTPARLGL